ncbi:MAG TPA: fatty acid desaturase [Allosphingosinicella sp.]|jgi:omega-6 fatty acid desaturase (delta-12 desaturase)|nr:fatty acid desaturase [Allosphingosinicella sp.]
MTQVGAVAPVADAKALFRQISVHANPAFWRSIGELVLTAGPLVLLLAIALVAVNAGYWIAMLLTIPAGAFLMRMFMIQHDCGHGSYFRSRRANDWVGRVIGLLTLTPYEYWRRSHAEHHARNGHLDHRGMGDILTLTASEYRNLPAHRRLLYRLYRNPLVMFGLGPAFIFLIQFRLPVGLMKGGREPWISTMASNLVLAAIAGAMLWFGILGLFLLVYIPTVVVAATGGVWMFYVQHQFEDARWSCNETWSFHDAALHGSSHYDLPPFLRWLSANIGIHHIHHLASRIPFYRLSKVLRERPELRNVSRLTLRQSFATVKLKLWDEDAQRLITFREARAAAA